MTFVKSLDKVAAWEVLAMLKAVVVHQHPALQTILAMMQRISCLTLVWHWLRLKEEATIP